MFTIWWMDKQIVVYLYNGILSSYKKEWSIHTCHNMNESWKHYYVRETRYERPHRVWWFHFDERSRMNTFISGESRLVVGRLWVGGMLGNGQCSDVPRKKGLGRGMKPPCRTINWAMFATRRPSAFLGIGVTSIGLPKKAFLNSCIYSFWEPTVYCAESKWQGIRERR